MDTQDVFNALNGFSGSSSRILGFRAQHLLDAMCEYAAPTTQDCSQTYTSWIIILLTGKANPLFSRMQMGPFCFPLCG